MSGWRNRAALGALMALAPLAMAAAPPSPQPQSIFGIHPASGGAATITQGHFRFTLTAGSTGSDALMIENFSDTPLVVHVYAADLVHTQGGGAWAPTQEGASLTGVGSWLTVANPIIKLAPHQVMTDKFTVRVPASAAPGEQQGAVVAAADIGSNGAQTIQARAGLITEVVVTGPIRAPMPPGPAPRSGVAWWAVLTAILVVVAAGIGAAVLRRRRLS